MSLSSVTLPGPLPLIDNTIKSTPTSDGGYFIGQNNYVYFGWRTYNNKNFAVNTKVSDISPTIPAGYKWGMWVGYGSKGKVAACYITSPITQNAQVWCRGGNALGTGALVVYYFCLKNN